MNAGLLSLASWLFDFAAVASVLLAVALAARWILRRPAERMAVAWSTWLGLAALAIVTALPGWPRIAMISRIAESRVHEQSEMHLPASVAFEEPINELAEIVIAAPAIPMREPSAHFAALMRTTDMQWRSAIAVAWLGAGGLALVWTAVGLMQTWRLVVGAQQAPRWIHEELRRTVGKRRRAPGLAMSHKIATAAAVGVVRPRILLPVGADNETCAPAVRAALAHEWAHIRHCDLWLLAVERLLLPLVGWHSLFWLARRGVRVDQELLADAAAAGDRPLEYAEALVAWAQNAGPAPLGVAGLSLWGSKRTLSRRIAMLLDPNRCASSPVNRGWQVVVAVVLLMLVGGLSVVSLAPLTADEPPLAQEPPRPANPRPVDQPAVAEQSASNTQVKVFTSRGGDAVARANMLQGVLGSGASATRPLRITGDARTNSIIAAGSTEDLEVIRGILERLDAAAPSKNVPAPGTYIAPTTSTATTRPAGQRATFIPAVAVQAGQSTILNCAVLEVDKEELLKSLPAVQEGPQPSPGLSVVVQENKEWQSVLEKLQAAKDTKVISMPRMMTLDRQTAQLEIATESPAPPGEAAKPGRLALTITPRLSPGRTDEEREVQLAVAVNQITFTEAADNKAAKYLRNFSTQFTLPPSKVVIIADRSTPKSALVLAIEASVVPVPYAQQLNTPVARNELPARLQAVELKLAGEDTTSRAAAAGLRHELLRLRREIDRLLEDESPARPENTVPAPTYNPSTNQPRAAATRAVPKPGWATQPPAPATAPVETPLGRESARAAAERRARETQVKLMELDLQDAELEVEAAKAELQHLQEDHRKGLVSISQVEKARLAVRRAEIRVQKLSVVLEAERRQATGSPNPNNLPNKPIEPAAPKPT